MTQLAWGIIGTGNIAKKLASGLAASKTGKLLAVASRSQQKADEFGKQYKAARCYGSYEALLADKEVKAVYISTPHPMHAEWAIKACEAGKHVLCEKPIGINHAEAMAIVEAAIRNNVFLMEAFMYRCHPQTQKLAQLIREKVVGEVRVIQASFRFPAGFNAESRLFANRMAGGGILDVGCYATSMAGMIAGLATGQEWAEFSDFKAVGHLGQSGVDEWTVASVKYPGEIVAQLATGVAVTQENALRVFGTDGSILVPSPWFCGRGEPAKILVSKKGKTDEIVIENAGDLYTLEVDTVAGNLDKKQAPSPAMTWNDTLGNMRALDAWREQLGLVYEIEKPGNVPTVHRRALAPAKKHNMKYGAIAGLEKKVSRLVMGVDNQKSIPHACVMFDDFIERGGTVFDTAFVYGGGKCEQVLGHYIKGRGIREQVVILDKGAHTPECYPEALTRQFKISLERLQMDYVDIYMMHRDNPQVPIGEFVEVLSEHKRAGRMRAFGGSNWTIERIEAFNAYARQKGLTGLAAVSNNFSLARMVEPPWGGCMSASEPKWREWFKQTQMTLMPWSSQARGFFTERAHPDNKSDAELVRCWYCEDNWRRRERVVELAKKRGVLPINIALAYVLCQPFPTFPLIGPRTLGETRTSLPALDVELSPQEVKWLNLEA